VTDVRTHLERWKELAHVRGKKQYVRHEGPEGCVRAGIAAEALWIDRFKVVALCRKGELVGVEGPLRMSQPNGKRRATWVQKESLERYIEAHKEEIAVRALRKGLLK
jgi:hypothetical protein